MPLYNFVFSRSHFFQFVEDGDALCDYTEDSDKYDICQSEVV
jgi:hypothetical protein